MSKLYGDQDATILFYPQQPPLEFDHLMGKF